nr:MAG TPA: hypothetical protein [Caudoviricetes sp.]
MQIPTCDSNIAVSSELLDFIYVSLILNKHS